jgi:integrase
VDSVFRPRQAGDRELAFPKPDDALRLLKKRLGEIVDGRLIVSSIEKTRFEDLAEMLIHDYEINGRRSQARAKRSLAHLREFFGLTRVLEITSDRVSAYIAFRKRQRTANATINRELAALKRMFRLGKRSAKVAEIPYISLLQEDNVRKGFFEREQLEAVLAHLPEYLKPVAEVAYITGWRVTSEILTRQWQHVDLTGGWLRLEPGETKNRKGRNFPFTRWLRRLLTTQRERTTALEAARGRIPWCFTVTASP